MDEQDWILMMGLSKDVKELLQDFEVLNPDLAKIIVGLRKKIMALSSKLDEQVKYGGVVFMKNGTLLGGLFLSKKHVSLEFSFGSELKDKFGVLEGKGKYRRHLKFKTLEDIKKKEAAFYMDQAMK